MNTYLFKSKWFLNIDKYFQERGNWKKYDSTIDKNITFLYVDGPHIYEDKTHYTLKAKIKNLIDDTKYNIADKNRLYYMMKKINEAACKKFMMDQYFVNKNNYTDIPKKLFDNKIWILKPIQSFQGKGIELFHNYDDFIYYISKYNRDSKIGKSGWVLADYISNPLLYNDRKFHIRMYYMHKIHKNGKCEMFMLKRGRLYTAKEKFVMADYSNIAIHDTHYVEGFFFIYPDEFSGIYGEDKYDHVYKQMLELGKVLKDMIKDSKCWSESEVCFEIFGADIMILDDFSIKVLEVNDKVGYSCPEDIEVACVEFNDYFLRNLLEMAIDYDIEPANEVRKMGGWIDVESGGR